MMKPARIEQKQKTAKLPGLLRPRDLEGHGIPRNQLQRMVEKGEVERISRGLYRLREAPVTELETIAAVGKKTPHAIVCLLTALQVHGIGTQMPREVWIALDRKARKPVHYGIDLRVVRFSGVMLSYGIVTQTILGVPVRITSPARTIVDCFRYRHKIGLDVAIEALRDAVRTRSALVSQIVRAAEVCRARTVLQPYLDSLVR